MGKSLSMPSTRFIVIASKGWFMKITGNTFSPSVCRNYHSAKYFRLLENIAPLNFIFYALSTGLFSQKFGSTQLLCLSTRARVVG